MSALVNDLQARVLEQPGDIDIVRVWADALLEVEDDRGQFIVLQLAAEDRELTAKEQRLERQLLKANRSRWLGKAEAAIDGTKFSFRNGLLYSAVLSQKATTEHLAAPEFRSVEQLWSPSIDLLAHENLVSLARLGCCAVPRPHSREGPVGFDYTSLRHFELDQILELAELRLPNITHVEVWLPRELDVSEVIQAFPKLKSILLGTSWAEPARSFEPMLSLVTGMDDVILANMGERTRIGEVGKDAFEWRDAFFVERRPHGNTHLVEGRGELYRSYLRRNGELHAVFTDAGNKSGFSPHHPGAHDLESIFESRMAVFAHMPAVDSLSFRQRSNWPAEDVEALTKRTTHLKNVVLPKPKKSSGAQSRL
jgi:hypothetical protein